MVANELLWIAVGWVVVVWTIGGAKVLGESVPITMPLSRRVGTIMTDIGHHPGAMRTHLHYFAA